MTPDNWVTSMDVRDHYAALLLQKLMEANTRNVILEAQQRLDCPACGSPSVRALTGPDGHCTGCAETIRAAHG